jgi:hypothetical protein
MWGFVGLGLAFGIPGLWAGERMSVEERAGARTELTLSLPSPGEFFAALEKTGSPNWLLAGRAALDLSSSSRSQLALNLGAGVADGYLAVEQQNSQEVKNIGRDILAIAKKLNVSEGVMARGSSINEFAENNEWMVLEEELEATRNEISLALEEQMDADLLTFIAAGAWLRALQAVLLIIGDAPEPGAANLLHQSDIAQYLLERLKKLPEKSRQDQLVANLVGGLGELQQNLALPPGEEFTPEQLQFIENRAGQLLVGLLAAAQPGQLSEPDAATPGTEAGSIEPTPGDSGDGTSAESTPQEP